jgi:chromosome segregation ATPase
VCEKVFQEAEELKKSVEIAFDERKLTNRTIEQLQNDKSTLENEIELVVKKWKDSKKALKAKEKELSELSNKNSDITKTMAEVQSDLSTLTSKVNKDKKDDEKKQKKDKKKDFLDKLKPSDNLECTLFDFRTETLMKLESHNKMFHTEHVAL